MSDTALHGVLKQASRDLTQSGVLYALVGGFAVSARTEPRFTRDLDFAITAHGDRDAERAVAFLTGRGYRIVALLEQESAGRLATVRLAPSGKPSLIVDLLFASCGIEPEIVAAAEPIEVIEGVTVPVATIPHLIAMKVLARDDDRRPQDRIDLISLVAAAGETDLRSTREALGLIEARGFNRGRNLMADFEQLLPRETSEGTGP